jgi:hypothetical protein
MKELRGELMKVGTHAHSGAAVMSAANILEQQ